jgi:NIPSNAP
LLGSVHLRSKWTLIPSVHLASIALAYDLVETVKTGRLRKYAENWGSIVPRCGGHLIGSFLPYEGTNNVAWGLISFDTLAAYEPYKNRLKADPEARENFAMAQGKRIILREERNVVELVDATFNLLSKI